MEWYRVIKTIRGRKYVYLQKTQRVGRSVKTINKYVGPASGAKVKQKVVYHVTREKFDSFDFSKCGDNTGYANARFGVFFSEQENAARQFADEWTQAGERREVNVKKAILDIHNPLDLTIKGVCTKKDQASLLVALTFGADMSPDDALEFLNDNIDPWSFAEFLEGIYADPENKKRIQAAGYDGIVSRFGGDETGKEVKEYVAFEPSQIRMV